MIDFAITNSRVTVSNAPPSLIQMLDQRMRYPTQLADLEVDGMSVVEGWDGWIRLLHRPKRSPPWFPTGLLTIAYDCVHQLGLGQYAQVFDYRVRPKSDVPDCVDLELRDYQTEAVDVAIRDGRGVIWLPPRSGKTRILCEIVRQLALPTIWTVPTDAIATQTLATFDEFFGKYYAMHQVGSKGQDKAGNARVVIATDATASGLSREFYNTRKALVVDEFHHAASNRYKKIFSAVEDVYYRFGATGTFFRSGTDDMAMHAHLSNVLYHLDETALRDRGYLVPVKTLFVKTHYKRLRGVCGQTWIDGAGRVGIHEHQERNQLAARIIAMLHQAGRTVLVLVRTKKQGRLIKEGLSELLPICADGHEFKICEFISGDMPRSVQIKLLDAFKAGQGVRVLIGTSLIGEGVDLPVADALVMAGGGKAGVQLSQSMYRICTAVPGKKYGILVDFVDSHNAMLLRHTLSRLEMYHANPIFDVDVVDSL